MKKVISLLLSVLMMTTLLIHAAAADGSGAVVEANVSIQSQASALMTAVDTVALKSDVLENVVDPSVPRAIRESVDFGAEISTDEPSNDNLYELKVNSTVQKVGEINCGNGEIATMYVAASATEIKEDSGSASKLGARVWTTVWWIDNFGPKNELYAAQANWDTDDCSYEFSNKRMKYGTSDPTGFLLLDYKTLNIKNYVDGHYVLCEEGEYVGLTLACVAEMNVGPSPVKITCWARSGITT